MLKYAQHCKHFWGTVAALGASPQSVRVTSQISSTPKLPQSIPESASVRRGKIFSPTMPSIVILLLK